MNTGYNKAFWYLYFSRVQKICVPTIGDTVMRGVSSVGGTLFSFVVVCIAVISFCYAMSSFVCKSAASLVFYP